MKILILPLFLISFGVFAQEEHPIANHPDNDSCSFYLPNVVTPDGDCYDCHAFAPVFSGDCKYSDYSFTIFNRWGEIIFKSEKPDEKWWCDEFADGTYIWQLKFTTERGSKRKHRGHVTVLK
ncbi:gliding motility-associated C-terminal domain-containing protein [Crocinitomix catalasitica]|nr:gliding motility-associated C-terminal domain-containing protein [Crocinitomix catalasitica]